MVGWIRWEVRGVPSSAEAADSDGGGGGSGLAGGRIVGARRLLLHVDILGTAGRRRVELLDSPQQPAREPALGVSSRQAVQLLGRQRGRAVNFNLKSHRGTVTSVTSGARVAGNCVACAGRSAGARSRGLRGFRR